MITTRYHFEIIESTNKKAGLLAREGAPHGTLVTADVQEAGVGRRGRSWSSEKDAGIYMSMVLRPDLKPEEAPGLTLVAALSVVKAVEVCICEGMEDAEASREEGQNKALLPTPQIKWPNDVVLNKKKVCGILTEMNLKGTVIDSVIVGIGINVHQNHFPEELKEMATSLDIETGGYCSRSRLIEHTLRYFEIYYEKYLQTGDCTLLQQEYESYLANKEELVKVLDPAGAYEGIAKGITPRGELMVDVGSGLRYVDSGEVSVRGIYGYV
jgi:BirA family biotin operon repressor/biotin-[acetyl-CoA-carboxylase] ligase